MFTYINVINMFIYYYFSQMRGIVAVSAVALVCAVWAAEDKDAERPKTFRRLIPADVLRGN